MKIEKTPDFIDPSLNLEQIRKECLERTKKTAYYSAGAAIIPIPFFDVVVDLSMLTQVIPDINARFGLAPEHISVYDPETKKIHWNELRKRGFEFSGFLVARTAMKKSFNGFFAKIATKQVTKFIPLGGQIIAASLGYFMMKKITELHIEDCYNLAKRIQQKSLTLN
ncbi:MULTISPECIES: hypothetical protein [unclassified Acinetobacter]|uniref:hypothetical protein n=1 Tax=unclassified Acinetobacter TaxID=196816 RepID=UPI0002CF2C59|nr:MULTISPECIES: hypothetical protein [unclassified Acinetobacter]ENU31617.1 hypothetical protein F991_00384 [Acinetobacter sp. CIP-A165]ENW97029.1 hypothetical protein F903_00850 [Acinetobacter sp. NIPH 298]